MSTAISLYYNESHGYYDMPLRGNVGLNGEEKLLNDLKNKNNTFFVVTKDDHKLDDIDIEQFMVDLKEYVKNNYNKIDELEEFEIYYGKKESIVNEY